MDTRGGGGIATFHCEKRLGDGDGDLVTGVRHDGAVTLDHTQLAWCGRSQCLVGVFTLRRLGLRVLAGGVGMHEGLHDQ